MNYDVYIGAHNLSHEEIYKSDDVIINLYNALNVYPFLGRISIVASYSSRHLSGLHPMTTGVSNQMFASLFLQRMFDQTLIDNIFYINAYNKRETEKYKDEIAVDMASFFKGYSNNFLWINLMVPPSKIYLLPDQILKVVFMNLNELL